MHVHIVSTVTWFVHCSSCPGGLTNVSDKVLRTLTCVNKVLRVVVVWVSTLCSLEKYVGVLVRAAVFTQDLSYLL